MTTLVTGATGFLGSAIARELLKDGRNIKLLARDNADLQNIKGLDAEIAIGDLRDRESLKSAFKGCSKLYHAAAFYSLWSKDKKLIYDINVQGTRNILETALDLGLESVVYTSTVGCIGLSKDRTPTNEDYPMDPATLSNDYKLSKFQAEKIALEMHGRGLPVVIVNPSTPIGPRDIKPTPTGKIILDVLNGKMPAYVDTGLNLVHVDDVAEGHFLALKYGKYGDRYILGGENLDFKNFLDLISLYGNKPKIKIKINPNFLFPLAYINQFLFKFVIDKTPSLTVDGLKMSKKKMFFSSSKAKNKLRYRPRIVKNAIKESVIWFSNFNSK